MSNTKITLSQVAKLGATMGRDNRPITNWRFYSAAAALIGDRTGDAATTMAESIRWKAAEYVFGGDSVTDEDVKRSQLPSAGHILKTAKLAVRFAATDETDRNVSLEVYRDAAARGGGLDPETGKPTRLDDADAIKAVRNLAAELGRIPTVDDGRAKWPTASGKTRRKGSTTEPMTIGEMVAYMLSQPNAVTAYVTDSETAAAAIELANLLNSAVTLAEQAA